MNGLRPVISKPDGLSSFLAVPHSLPPMVRNLGFLGNLQQLSLFHNGQGSDPFFP